MPAGAAKLSPRLVPEDVIVGYLENTCTWSALGATARTIIVGSSLCRRETSKTEFEWYYFTTRVT